MKDTDACCTLHDRLYRKYYKSTTYTTLSTHLQRGIAGRQELEGEAWLGQLRHCGTLPRNTVSVYVQYTLHSTVVHKILISIVYLAFLALLLVLAHPLCPCCSSRLLCCVCLLPEQANQQQLPTPMPSYAQTPGTS